MQQIGIPFKKGSETSRAAAEKIAGAAHSIRMKIFEIIKNAPDGLTDQEIEENSGYAGNTMRPRRTELMQRREGDGCSVIRLGLIKDSGRKRRTKSGCWATVWCVV